MEWINIASNEVSIDLCKRSDPGEISKDNLAGGFFEGKKEIVWQADEKSLNIMSTVNGQNIFNSPLFNLSEFSEMDLVTAHNFATSDHDRFLAIVFRAIDNANTEFSLIVIYSLKINCIINYVKVCSSITAISFLPNKLCIHSLLNLFDGCLILGTERGEIMFLDLQLQRFLETTEQSWNTFSDCSLHNYNVPLSELRVLFESNSKTSHFAVRINITKTSVTCISVLNELLAIGIGTEEGQLKLFDLKKSKSFDITGNCNSVMFAPLVKIIYIEPIDDPCPCFYLWGMFQSEQSLSIVLFSVIYDKTIYEQSSSFIEAFRKCSVRYEYTLEESDTRFPHSQPVYSTCTLREEFKSSLCFFSWFSLTENKNKLILFDLNQWYKEEMPNQIQIECNPRYIAAFNLIEKQMGLEALMEQSSIAHYNSLYRSEEHFYPNSLSFDCLLLLNGECKTFTWQGVQNQIINLIKSSNTSLFINPTAYFNDILEAGLLPQFVEVNDTSNFNEKTICEVILSFALENGCYNLLRDCINSWLHGTISGFNTMFMDWIWNRVNTIVYRCKMLFIGLFDNTKYFLDEELYQELDHLSRQLNFLSDLTTEMLNQAKDRYNYDHSTKIEKLRIKAGFYSVLVWMLNNNFLIKKEVVNQREVFCQIKYSLDDLQQMYADRRKDLQNSFLNLPMERCGKHSLFIDYLIEKEFQLQPAKSLNGRERKSFYPPQTLQEALKMFLVESADLESKYLFLIYFFLDLIYIDGKEDHGILEKFTSSFDIEEPVLQKARVFWTLDKGFLKDSVNLFLCPHSKFVSYPKWIADFMIEALLSQKEFKLALRVLKSVPMLISQKLKAGIMLCNDLFYEAFQVARLDNESSRLLEMFYIYLIKKGRYDIIQQLDLNDKEISVLKTISVNRSSSSNIEQLHMAYILQKSKFVDALRFVKENTKQKDLNNQHICVSEQTPNLVFSAFKSTFPPVSRNIADLYFSKNDALKKTSLSNDDMSSPLSTQLLKQNLLKENFLYNSAISANMASIPSVMNDKEVNNCQNLAFLRKPQDCLSTYIMPQTSVVSIPYTYKATEKRSLNEFDDTSSPQLPKPKRQRTFRDTFEESLFEIRNHVVEDDDLCYEHPDIQGILKTKDNQNRNLNDLEKNLRFDSSYRNKSQIEENVMQAQTPFATSTTYTLDKAHSDEQCSNESETNETFNQSKYFSALSALPTYTGPVVRPRAALISSESTVVGSITNIGSEFCNSNSVSQSVTLHTANSEMRRNFELDTTLGMTSYEVNSLDPVASGLPIDSSKNLKITPQNKSPVLLDEVPSENTNLKKSFENQMNETSDDAVRDIKIRRAQIEKSSTNSAYTSAKKSFGNEIRQEKELQVEVESDYEVQEVKIHEAPIAISPKESVHISAKKSFESELRTAKDLEVEVESDHEVQEVKTRRAQIAKSPKEPAHISAKKSFESELRKEKELQVEVESDHEVQEVKTRRAQIAKSPKESAHISAKKSFESELRKEKDLEVEVEVEVESDDELREVNKQRAQIADSPKASIKERKQREYRDTKTRCVSVPPQEVNKLLNTSSSSMDTNIPRKTRGQSMPPKDVKEKLNKSTLMEELLNDSPATRTRSRTRLSSIESDLDTVGLTKISKRRSLAEMSSDSPKTPSKTRRASVQNLKAEDSTNDIKEETGSGSSDLKLTEVNRRLTRTQAALLNKMESPKSIKARQSLETYTESTEEEISTERLSIKSSSKEPKGRKRRNSRSESDDDAFSISSGISSSDVKTPIRRLRRNSNNILETILETAEAPDRNKRRSQARK